MKFKIESQMPPENLKACQMIALFEDSELTGPAKKIDTLTGGFIANLIKSKTYIPQRGAILPIFDVKGFNAILLVGCGKEENFTKSTFKKVIIEATKILDSYHFTEVTCYFAEVQCEKTNEAYKVKQIILAMRESLYRFDIFKSNKDPKVALQKVTIHCRKESISSCERAKDEAVAIADGMTLAKNLGNLPSNICTPTFLADQARDITKSQKKMKIEILNEAAMRKLGMGAILAVSQGSAEEAKMICLNFRGGSKNQAPICIIGKGITFDTGGNSIKSADGMVGMKYDMSGGAAVLGVMKALAILNLPINVVGIVAAAENMPGGTAYKPEDIITTMSGQTVEVISTDAEGRLALADAITYSKRYKPEVVIDIATLTGAVVIALGFHVSGLLSNDEKLAHELLRAGEESNDRAWQLPLYEEYQEQLKSPFADLSNVGGRAAGVITAGCFLSRFAKEMRWAHLDVAGTAAMMVGGADRKSTGRPVPLLMQYLIDRTERK